MIKVGIVGCGRIIEDGHVPAFAALADRYEVVAVADTSDQRRNIVADKLGVSGDRRFNTWQDLLGCDDVDLVDMALPHFLHLPSLLDAVAAGKAVLMEKPMATTLAEADAMMAAVGKSSRPACIIHNYLYQPHNLRGLELVHSGAIGEPYLYRCEHFSGGHYHGAAGYDPAWRTKAARGGGGAVIDNAYHQLYLAENYLGSPATSVYAGIGTYVQQIDVEDLGLIQLAHADGSRSIINQGWVGAGAQAVDEIHGTEGILRFQRGSEHPAAIVRGESIEPIAITGEFRWGFEGLFKELADALESGSEPPIPFAAGYRNFQIVMAAYESGRSGQAVTLD